MTSITFSDDASVATTHAAGDDHALPEGLICGENGRVAHGNTGDACLDFFFSVTPDVTAWRFEELVRAAWDEDAWKTLRYCCLPPLFDGCPFSRHSLTTADMCVVCPRSLQAHLPGGQLPQGRGGKNGPPQLPQGAHVPLQVTPHESPLSPSAICDPQRLTSLSLGKQHPPDLGPPLCQGAHRDAHGQPGGSAQARLPQVPPMCPPVRNARRLAISSSLPSLHKSNTLSTCLSRTHTSANTQIHHAGRHALTLFYMHHLIPCRRRCAFPRRITAGCSRPQGQAHPHPHKVCQAAAAPRQASQAGPFSLPAGPAPTFPKTQQCITKKLITMHHRSS